MGEIPVRMTPIRIDNNTITALAHRKSSIGSDIISPFIPNTASLTHLRWHRLTDGKRLPHVFLYNGVVGQGLPKKGADSDRQFMKKKGRIEKKCRC